MSKSINSTLNWLVFTCSSSLFHNCMICPFFNTSMIRPCSSSSCLWKSTIFADSSRSFFCILIVNLVSITIILLPLSDSYSILKPSFFFDFSSWLIILLIVSTHLFVDVIFFGIVFSPRNSHNSQNNFKRNLTNLYTVRFICDI